MSTIQIGQLAFMCAFFSVMFAGIGLYMCGRIFAMLLFKKLHSEHVCPVCKAPMEDDDGPKREPKKTSRDRRDRKLADMVTDFFVSLPPEQIEALTDAQREKLLALGDLCMTIQSDASMESGSADEPGKSDKKAEA